MTRKKMDTRTDSHMSYEEIEEVLRRHNQNQAIERLRKAIGAKVREIQRARAPDGMTAVPNDDDPDAARYFFAEQVSGWLDGSYELTPESVLESQPSRMEAWAFAQLVHRLVDYEEAEDEVVADPTGESTLLQICDANTQLALKIVELAEKNQKLQSIETSLNKIRLLADAEKLPIYNEVGNRKLELWERIEYAFVEMLRDRSEAGDDEHTLLRVAADNICWMAEKIHQAYHEKGTWRECNKGVCGSVEHMLAQIGFDTDLNRREVAP